MKAYDRYRKELLSIDQLISHLNGRKGWLVAILKSMEEGKLQRTGLLKMSDHAALRFIERVGGEFKNVRDIYEKMVPPELEETILRDGSGVYLHPSGCRIIVQDSTLVTVLGKEMDSKLPLQKIVGLPDHEEV